MEKTWTYKIENGDLIEEFFVFKSTVPIHELKKVVIDNLKEIDFLCEILKKMGYEATFITNQELTSALEDIKIDYVLDLYDYRCLYDRRDLLFGLEYAFYDNGHILDISANIEGFSYTIYNILGEKVYSDIYEDEESDIYDVAQDIMVEYDMNMDSSVMLRYTNFKEMLAAKEEVDVYMPKHIESVLDDNTHCSFGGSMFLPVHLNGFEKCDIMYYLVMHDGIMTDEKLSEILNRSITYVAEKRVVFCPVPIEDYANPTEATRKLVQVFEINKPRFSFVVEDAKGNTEEDYSLSNALRKFAKNKKYKHIVMVENLSGRPTIRKAFVYNRKFNFMCEYDNVFERQIFHRARLKMNFIH